MGAECVRAVWWGVQRGGEDTKECEAVLWEFCDLRPEVLCALLSSDKECY